MRVKNMLLAAVFALCALQCAAQQPAVFEAEVDKTAVDIAEDIHLTLTLRSSSAEEAQPQMPSLPNFNIYSENDISRSVVMINGKISSVQSFSYTLSPRFAGKSTIGAFSVKVGGKEYKTEPIEVEVSRSAQGNAQASLAKTAPARRQPAQTQPAQTQQQAEPAKPAKTPDFFMTAQIDKQEAWLNEQINLKIKFYQGLTLLGNPQYTRPQMDGLVFEEIKSNQQFEVVEGRKYSVTEFDIALFGIIAGEASVGPAYVDYAVANMMNRTMDMFMGLVDARRVATQPQKIKIKPLPAEGRPAAFYGAVGADYAVKSSVDNAAPRAGEPLTLTTEITGKGNMRAIGDMPAPDMGAGFRVYETSSSFTTGEKDGVVNGVKIYKTVLVPRASGKFNIPAARFSYFDAAVGVYRSVRGNAVDLDVAPAASAQESGAASFAAGAAASPKAERINSDIAYIKEISARRPLLARIADFGRYNYAVFALLLATLFRLLKTRGAMNLRGLRGGALRAAKKALSRAKNAEEISEALSDYLCAKQGAPIGISTIADVAGNLKLGPQARKELEEIWQSLEMRKYAPSAADAGGNAAQYAAKTLAIIRRIEKETK
ncbi:MAG: BatD family protein [Elusimicrobiota bacterium]|jgi:hypothetical protein|nr:BatD family protein [Elusimicrobiota bacterium]